MIHLCPNYTIPYEPHFRRLLVPFIPSALAPVRPDLKRNDLWRSLTFVTIAIFCGTLASAAVWSTLHQG
jgi:hypothetical protein